MSTTETTLVKTKEHSLCPITGFCKKCGSHESYIKCYGTICVYSSNTVAVSHIIAQRLLAKEVMTLVETPSDSAP